MKKIFKILLLVFFSLVIPIILCDMILYEFPILLPVYIKRIMLLPFPTLMTDITISDKYRSYTLKPELKFPVKFGKDNLFSFTTKKFGEAGGFRTSSFETENILMGNSFTFGYGLNDNETIDFAIKKKYGKIFFNAGIPGYSFKHSYMLFKNYFLHFHPKRVVYLFVYNDIKEAYYYNEFLKQSKYESQFEFQSAERERMRKYKLDDSSNRLSRKINLTNVRYFLSWHSVIYNIIKNIFNGKIFNTYFQVMDTSDLQSYTNVNAFPLNSVIGEFKETLVKWRADVEKYNGSFAVAYIPYKEEINETYKVDYCQFRNTIEKICKDNSINMISLFKPLKKKGRCYFDYDDHINSTGAEIVADEINKFYDYFK